MHAEPTSLKTENVDAFIRALELRQAQQATVELDLQRMRIERPAASILSAALLSTLGRVPLVVRLPPDDTGLRDASLSTLAFAFANRAGKTSVEGLDLAPWRRSWSPGTRDRIGLLFSPGSMGESADEPSIFGRLHAAFVNPHRAAPTAGPTTVTQVVRPWLTHVLPSYVSNARDSRGNPGFVADVGHLIDELLENVREHACTPAPGASTRSLVQALITRGAQDRLHVIVLDTGPGIGATARLKLGDAPKSDAQLVRALFQGELAGWHRSRGQGLPRVWSKVQAWRGASLQLATNGVRATGSAGVLNVGDRGFSMTGTVLAATFPLPPVALH